MVNKMKRLSMLLITFLYIFTSVAYAADTIWPGATIHFLPGVPGWYGTTHIRSTDLGQTWEPVGDLPTDYVESISGAVNSVTREINAFWARSGNGSCDVRHSVSDDAGETWSDPHVVTPLDYCAGVSDGTVDSMTAHLHAVWNNSTGPIWHSRSIDGGLTWSPPIDTGLLNPSGWKQPSIAARGGKVAIINGIGSVAFSQNDGQTWNIESVGGSSYTPHINVDHIGRFYAAWDGVGFAYSDDGVTWTNSSPGVSCNVPQLAVDRNGVLHMACRVTDWASSATIYYFQSPDRGDTWSSATVVTAEDDWSRNVGITADGTNIHVIWDRSDHPWKYSRSTDGGQSWSNPIEIHSDGYRRSVILTRPAICKPSIDIEINRHDFTVGDILTAQAHVDNSCVGNIDVEAKIWVELPNGSVTPLIDPHTTITLEAGAHFSVSLLDYEFSGSEGSGAYEVGGRFLSPLKGEDLDSDIEPFTFNP